MRLGFKKSNSHNYQLQSGAIATTRPTNDTVYPWLEEPVATSKRINQDINQGKFKLVISERMKKS